MFCGHCMMDVPEESQFCMKCGTKLGEIICSACGTTVPKGSQFCKACGVRLGENGEQLFKVRLEKWFNRINNQLWFHLVINHQQKYLLTSGGILEFYLPAGSHLFELVFGEVLVEKQTLAIDADVLVSLKCKEALKVKYYFEIV